MLPPLFGRPPADPTEERRIRCLAAARHAPASQAAARPHHHRELGRRPGRPDRRAAWLPSPHRLPLAAPLQRRRHRRPGGPAPLGPPAAAFRTGAWTHHRPGRNRPTPTAGPPGRRWPGRGRCAAVGPLDPGRPGRCRPGRRHPGRPQPGPPHPGGRGGALADGALLEHQRRPPVRPNRAAIIARSTAPPPATIVICADELGPVLPGSFPPPPGWSTDGHRIKAPLQLGPRSRQDPGGWRGATLRRPGGHPHGPVPYLGRLPAAAGRGRAGQPDRSAGGHHRQPVQPLQLLGPSVAGRPSADPPGVHPGRCVLAEAAGGMVAAGSPRGVGRPALR
jgi:hypothetical protein